MMKKWLNVVSNGIFPYFYTHTHLAALIKKKYKKWKIKKRRNESSMVQK